MYRGTLLRIFLKYKKVLMKVFLQIIDYLLLLIFRKRLFVFIFKAFLGPFIVSFLVLMLIFLVQTLISYQAEIFGKGLDMKVYLELVFYLSFNVVPKALPFAVMMGGLITYGSLGEHSELKAIKSSGISLLRIIFPTFLFSVAAGLGLYLLGEYILPKTNMKFYRMLYDIKTKEPSFDLKPGVFYSNIDGYRIKVKEKNEKGALKNVIVYDHTSKRGNVEVVIADSGRLINYEEQGLLIFELFNGIRYSEQSSDNSSHNKSSLECSRTSFSKVVMPFDISALMLKNSPDKLFSKNRWMMTSKQLMSEVDSVGVLVKERKESLTTSSVKMFNIDFVGSDSLVNNKLMQREFDSNQAQERQIVQSLCNDVTNMSFHLERENSYIEWRIVDYVKLWVEFHHRKTEPVACVIFLLIGACLGGVLKKGGIGMPMLVTVMMFLLHYVLSQTFDQYARTEVLPHWIGGWGSVIVMALISVWIAYKTFLDKRIF